MALSDTPKLEKHVPYHRRGCELGRWVRGLPDADQDVFDTWLRDEELPASLIALRINDDEDYEFVTSEDRVRYHRSGVLTGGKRGCQCGAV